MSGTYLACREAGICCCDNILHFCKFYIIKSTEILWVLHFRVYTLESTNTSIEMRHTDSSLIFFHLSNSKSWLTSLLASIWSLLTCVTLGGKKSRFFPDELPTHFGIHSLLSASPHFGVISLCALRMPLLDLGSDLLNQKYQS